MDSEGDKYPPSCISRFRQFSNLGPITLNHREENNEINKKENKIYFKKIQWMNKKIKKIQKLNFFIKILNKLKNGNSWREEKFFMSDFTS